MRTYSIQFLIDPDDLRTLHATHRTIVLARAVKGALFPNVVWQSFAPRTEDVVTWSEAYSIYAANTRLVEGAQIVPARSLLDSACDGSAYTFAPDGSFHGPYYGGGMLGPNQFCVMNDVPAAWYPSLIFGLGQTAIINGLSSSMSPLNAQAVPAHHRALFTTANTVYVWLQSGLMSGTVCTHRPTTLTAIDFDRSINVQTLKYDRADDRFIPYSYVKKGFIFTMPNVAWPGSVGYAQKQAETCRL
jgi:hypothetical protein